MGRRKDESLLLGLLLAIAAGQPGAEEAALDWLEDNGITFGEGRRRGQWDKIEMDPQAGVSAETAIALTRSLTGLNTRCKDLAHENGVLHLRMENLQVELEIALENNRRMLEEERRRARKPKQGYKNPSKPKQPSAKTGAKRGRKDKTVRAV